MNGLPQELLLRIWQEAYADVDQGDDLERAQARQWLLDRLFDSRMTLGIG